jgi:hypothetical protein
MEETTQKRKNVEDVLAAGLASPETPQMTHESAEIRTTKVIKSKTGTKRVNFKMSKTSTSTFSRTDSDMSTESGYSSDNSPVISGKAVQKDTRNLLALVAEATQLLPSISSIAPKSASRTTLKSASRSAIPLTMTSELGWKRRKLPQAFSIVELQTPYSPSEAIEKIDFLHTAPSVLFFIQTLLQHGLATLALATVRHNQDKQRTVRYCLSYVPAKVKGAKKTYHFEADLLSFEKRLRGTFHFKLGQKSNKAHEEKIWVLPLRYEEADMINPPPIPTSTVTSASGTTPVMEEIPTSVLISAPMVPDVPSIPSNTTDVPIIEKFKLTSPSEQQLLAKIKEQDQAIQELSFALFAAENRVANLTQEMQKMQPVNQQCSCITPYQVEIERLTLAYRQLECRSQEAKHYLQAALSMLPDYSCGAGPK